MNNKEFFQQCWRAEVQPTIVALKALPEADKLAYKPAEKYRTAKQLVDHFVSHVEDLVEAAETGVLNHRLTADFPSVDNAIAVFEKESERLMSLLDATDEATWDEKKVPMLIFGNSFGEKPLGQTSTYYRPMGATQPAIYGPTDEMTEAMTSSSN